MLDLSFLVVSLHPPLENLLFQKPPGFRIFEVYLMEKLQYENKVIKKEQDQCSHPWVQ